jgi:hypothetical protein
LANKHSGLARRKRERPIALAVAMLIMFLCVAKQSYGWGKTRMGYDLEQQVMAAGLDLGPFRIHTVLYLADAGYDSNVYRTPDNPIKDYSITFGPGFYVYLPIKGKVVISVYESPQYVYFMKTERERTWNNFFNGQVSFILNRFFISLGKSYSVAREIWNTEIDIRPQRKEDSWQGSLQWQLTKKSSLLSQFVRAKYSYEDLSFAGSGINQELNRTETRANITAYHRVSFRTTFFLNLEYGDFEFQYPTNPRDSKSYGLYSGFEFSPFGILRGRIKLGYKYFDVLKTGIKDYKGIIGDTSISIRIFRPLRIRANYRRDIQFSAYYSNAYYLENVLGSGASLYLFKNIRLDYNYYLGRNSYPAPISGQSSVQIRKDNYKAQSAGIYFRLKKSIALGVIGVLWDRNSTVAWANAKQTSIGANLIYDF